MNIDSLKKTIRDIPDFPKPGIIFKDITTLLKDGQKFKQAIETISAHYRDKGITKVAAVEARGFILGSAVAYNLGCGFIPIRKKGKLPAQTREVTYSLEYGTDTLQIHSDALSNQDKVLMVDDLLATGGTARAACKLIESLGAKIGGIEFLIELTFLKGIDKLKGFPVRSIIKF